MNPSALRLFVRSILTEAVEKKKEEKKEKKEVGLPKSSGKLVDLKKELAALKQMRDELQVAKFAEKTASTEVEFANLAKFATELDKLKAGGVALENRIEEKIKELETKVEAEKNKIREMIGIAPKKGQEKMVDESEELEESFKSVEKKIEKQGKSKKAATKIAGAIANKKMHGAGKGPTSKQKTRIKENLGGKAIFIAVKAALENGDDVKVNDREIVRVVPLAGSFVMASGEVIRMGQVRNITVNDEPLQVEEPLTNTNPGSFQPSPGITDPGYSATGYHGD